MVLFGPIAMHFHWFSNEIQPNPVRERIQSCNTIYPWFFEDLTWVQMPTSRARMRALDANSCYSSPLLTLLEMFWYLVGHGSHSDYRTNRDKTHESVKKMSTYPVLDHQIQQILAFDMGPDTTSRTRMRALDANSCYSSPLLTLLEMFWYLVGHGSHSDYRTNRDKTHESARKMSTYPVPDHQIQQILAFDMGPDADLQSKNASLRPELLLQFPATDTIRDVLILGWSRESLRFHNEPRQNHESATKMSTYPCQITKIQQILVFDNVMGPDTSLQSKNGDVRGEFLLQFLATDTIRDVLILGWSRESLKFHNEPRQNHESATIWSHVEYEDLLDFGGLAPDNYVDIFVADSWFCLGSLWNLSDHRDQPSIKTSLIVSVAGNCSRNSPLTSLFLLWRLVSGPMSNTRICWIFMVGHRICWHFRCRLMVLSRFVVESEWLPWPTKYQNISNSVSSGEL